jgi:TolB protein
MELKLYFALKIKGHQMVNMRRLTYILFIGLFFVATPLHAERLRMVVEGANFRPYPVGVPDIRVVGTPDDKSKKAAQQLTGILKSAVDLVRPLELVDPQSYLNPEKESLVQPKYKNWLAVGASGLIRAGLKLDGSQVQLTMRFYDVVSQRQLIMRDFVENNTTASRAIHRFLDEVIKLLTGEEGILSSRVAFVRKTKEGKAIYTADITGANEQRITDPASLSLLPAWSRDGKSLLFTSYLRENPDLYRLNLTTRKLDWLSHKRGLNTGAAVSPDGKKIALTLSIDGNTEIYLMDRDGKNLTRLTDSWGQDISPTWSPDGKRIAFVSSRSGNPHIYVMNADGSNPKRLSFRGNYNQEPDWSPRADGKIVFTARDERLRYDIFLVDPQNGEMQRLTQDQGDNESPSFSPDGHHIIFTSTRPPHGGKKIYVMDVDGMNVRRISRRGGYHETPAWSPRLGY